MSVVNEAYAWECDAINAGRKVKRLEAKMEKAVAKIDELTAACKRESNKPFTGYAGSPSEALAVVRKILAN